MIARSLGVGLLCVLALLVSLAEGQRAKVRPKPKPKSAAPADPLVIKPGDPLSTRALVQFPVEISGVESWTVESRNHRGAIYCFTASPDGRFLATGGLDCTIRIWDVASGKMVRTLVGHNSHLYGLAWSPDGRTLASAGSWDGTVRLWNMETGKPYRIFRGTEMKTPCWHVSWSPDGTRLIMAGGQSGWIRVWNTSAEGPTDLMEFGQYLYVFNFSPDGSSFAIGGQQAGLSVIDFQTAKVAHTLGLTTDAVAQTSWSPDGKLLAAAGANNTTIWNVAEEKPVRQFEGASISTAFSPDGKLLAVGRSGVTYIFDVASGKTLATIPAMASRMLWPKEPGQLSMYYSDRLSTWKISEKPTPGLDTQNVGLAPPVWTQNRPIVTGLGSKKLSLWDSLSAKHLKDLEGHKQLITGVSWSRDGKLLASAAGDRTARIWDAKSGEALHTLEGHKGAILAIAFSADGKTLATAGNDNSVRLWGANGESEGVLEGHAGPVRALAWAPVGSVLASGGDDQTIFIWRGGAAEPIRKIEIHQNIHSLAFTTANKVLVLACGTADENLQVLNSTNGQLLTILKQGGSPPTVTALAWLPGVGSLFAGRGNYTCQLWDVGQQKVVHNYQTCSPIHYVTYTSGGATVVAGSNERTARFWDTGDGKLRGSIISEPGCAVMLSAEGHWKIDPDKQCDLVYIVQTPEGQFTLSPEQFTERFRMKNNPQRARITGR